MQAAAALVWHMIEVATRFSVSSVHWALACAARQGHDTNCQPERCRNVLHCDMQLTCSRRNIHLQQPTCMGAGRGRRHPENRDFGLLRIMSLGREIAKLGPPRQTSGITRRDWQNFTTWRSYWPGRHTAWVGASICPLCALVELEHCSCSLTSLSHWSGHYSVFMTGRPRSHDSQNTIRHILLHWRCLFFAA